LNKQEIQNAKDISERESESERYSRHITEECRSRFDILTLKGEKVRKGKERKGKDASDRVVD
jgi:hypothetical protein